MKRIPRHAGSSCYFRFALDNEGLISGFVHLAPCQNQDSFLVVKNTAFLSILVRQRGGGSSWQQSPAPRLARACHFSPFQQLSGSSPCNYDEKASRSAIAPHGQDTNVFPHKSLVAKALKFFGLCFIPVLPDIIVFTWCSIIYKHTKHSSLDSRLVLTRELPTKSMVLQRLAPEKDLSCCPRRPLLPSTARTGRERIRNGLFFHSLSLPETHKRADARGDLLPTADLLFIHAPATRSSPSAASGTPGSSRPHFAQSPVATPGALRMGQAPGTATSTSMTDKAVRVPQPFLGAGGASSVCSISSPSLQGFFCTLLKRWCFPGGPGEAAAPAGELTRGSPFVMGDHF